MSQADIQYLSVAKNILENGIEHEVEGAWYKSDSGKVTVKKLGKPVVMEFNLQEEFPILTSKYVPWKKARDEMFWIWILQSNLVEDLHKMGIDFWDEWMGADGTIGEAYGFIIKKYGLLDRLINKLTTNPNDRGMIVDLWDDNHISNMNIRPCAFLTMWDVTNGYLNCTLIQRSGDWGLGVAFNFTQYAFLVHMIAQVVNLKAGILTHVINNAHIYDRHYNAIKEQLTRPIFNAPVIALNPNVNNIYDFSNEDISILGYKHLNAGMLPMELATVINPFKEVK